MLVRNNNKVYEEGKYVVGVDIPVGEYFLEKTESDVVAHCMIRCGVTKQVTYSNSFSTFEFVKLEKKERVEFSNCNIIAVTKEDMIKQPRNGIYSIGRYRVGIDIPAGEYYVKCLEGHKKGYCNTTRNANQKSTIHNRNVYTYDFIEIKDGEYFKLENCSAIKADRIKNIVKPDGNSYNPGKYRVGTDIPAGEYFLNVVDKKEKAYSHLTSDANQKEEVYRNRFSDFDFVVAKVGEYLKLGNCTATLTDKMNSKISQSDGTYSDGKYRVGIDITAGKYEITPSIGFDNGLSAMPFDCNQKSIIKRENTNSKENIVVKVGEYITLKNCVIKANKIYLPKIYEVGVDIIAGEYFVKKEDGMENAYCGIFNDISAKEIKYGNKFSTFDFIKLTDGECVKFRDCTATHIDNLEALPQPMDNIYTDGKYRGGIDIPVGEYVIKKIDEEKAYCSTFKDPNNNDVTYSGEVKKIIRLSVKHGEYIRLRGCTATNLNDVIVDSGTYKTGIDIPAGEYFLKAIEKHEEVSFRTYTNKKKIKEAEFNYVNKFDYRVVSNGEYLELNNCIAVPVDIIKPFPTPNDRIYNEGKYRGGIDIPVGEYFVKILNGVDNAFCGTFADANEKECTYDTRFSTFVNLVVNEGEYVCLQGCTAICVDDLSFEEGKYEVGTDIPPGEYFLKKVNESKNAHCLIYNNSKKKEIIYDEQFITFDYITLSKGECVNLEACVATQVKFAEQLPKPLDNIYREGKYRSEIDMPKGEYYVELIDGYKDAYCAIYNDANKKSITFYEQVDKSCRMNINEGEYVSLHGCIATIHGADNFATGKYNVGVDISSGIYYLKAINEDKKAYCKIENSESIIYENTFNTFDYITINNGEYFELINCTITPIDLMVPTIHQENDIYMDGKYCVGIDIPAGEYFLEVNENQEVAFCNLTNDTNGLDIIYSEQFSTFDYVTFSEGEYVHLTSCTAKDASYINVEKEKIYRDGKYRVGMDIPSGEYFVKRTVEQSNSYYVVSGDINGKNITSHEQISHFSNLTIKDGDILKLHNCALIQVDDMTCHANEYEVGIDILEGEYFLQKMSDQKDASYKIFSDTNKETIVHENIFNNYDYINVSRSECIVLDNCIAKPVHIVEPIAAPVDKKYIAGKYRSGIDIPTGEYYVEIVDNEKEAHYTISTDSNTVNIISSEKFTNYANMKVSDGEYVTLNNCVAKSKKELRYISGKYEVGVDIPSGEYYIERDNENINSSCVITSNGKNTYNNNITTFDYVFIIDGDIVEFNNCFATPTTFVKPTVSLTKEKYQNGKYKGGFDIPVGDYYIENINNDGYAYCGLYSDANGKNAIYGNNFKTSDYVTINNDVFIDLRQCIAIPIDKANLILKSEDHIYGEGKYLGGISIPVGEYFVEIIGGYESAYCGVYKSPNVMGVIYGNHFNSFDYIKVNEGEYVDLRRCSAKIINTIEKNDVITPRIYQEGKYRVGTDLLKGRYFVKKIDGVEKAYLAAYNDANTREIINSKYVTNFELLTIGNCEYIKLHGCIAYPVNPRLSSNALKKVVEEDGTYKVGKDIPIGKYYIEAQKKLEEVAYYGIFNDNDVSNITYTRSNYNKNHRYEISILNDGEFVQFNGCTAHWLGK